MIHIIYIFMAQLLGKYQNISDVKYVYSHSLGGSTVLSITPSVLPLLGIFPKIW